MASQYRILIADDEEPFLQSITAFLEKERYQCDCATTAAAAITKLQNASYDLLIAEIKLPGSPELELVKKIAQTPQNLPAIIITDTPSLETAIQSIQLHVTAYLVKPFKPQELLEQINRAIRHVHLHKTIDHTRQRIQDWSKDLDELALPTAQNNDVFSPVTLDTYIKVTFDNMGKCFRDLHRLIQALAEPDSKQDICQLMSCPRLAAYQKSIRETIKIIEGTKSSFKSKELGELRQKLLTLVEHE